MHSNPQQSVVNVQILNSSSSSDDAESTYWLSDPCDSFDFFYNTVFIGSICLFGIAANLLSIVVLHLDRQNRVATFLLRSLAVADIIVLLTSFVAMSIFFGTHAIPGFYEHYTRYAIPYLKKVNPVCACLTQNVRTQYGNQENMYKALSELESFCKRYDENILVCFSVHGPTAVRVKNANAKFHKIVYIETLFR